VVKLTEKFDFVYGAVGVHPLDVKTKTFNYLNDLEKLVFPEKIVAVGEIGLDYHYEGYEKSKQLEMFEEELEFAERFKLPVVVHFRDAMKDGLQFVKKFKPKGVVHCFSGDATEAKIILDAGMYLGFTGVITYKSAQISRDVLKFSPIQRVLIETDCPYLSPIPMRGKRCDSTMLPFVIETISKIKNITPQKLSEITAKNAETLFNIKK
jgi:TatD DNase family protein